MLEVCKAESYKSLKEIYKNKNKHWRNMNRNIQDMKVEIWSIKKTKTEENLEIKTFASKTRTDESFITRIQ